MFGAKSKILLFILLVLCGLFSGCVSNNKAMAGTENDTNVINSKSAGEPVDETENSNENTFETSDETVLLNLIKDLESNSHETRLDAASELGEMGEPAADALVEKLGDESPDAGDVKSYILLALLETGDERAADVLIQNLDEGEDVSQNEAEEDEVRESSEEILHAVDAKDAALREYIADSLDEEYGTEADALVRALNAEEQNADIYITIALSGYGDPGPEGETEKLIEALKSENGHTRTAAVMALGELEEKSAVDPLLKKLTQDYPLIRASAALALGMIGDEAAVDTLLKEMKGSGDEHIRSSAAIALGKIGSEDSVPYLTERLRDGKVDVRSSAALALGMIGDETAVEPLIEVLESGKAGAEMVKSTLNTDSELRKCAVLALGEIGSKEATETLIGVLADEEEAQEIRKAAVQALGNIGDPETVDTLSGILNGAEVPASIKTEVISALGKIEDRKAADALIGQLGDKKLGSAARTALAGMGETAVEPLVECLSGGDEALKTEATLLLIEIGDERAVEPLIQAYK